MSVSQLVGKPIRMLINSKCYALRAQLLWVKRKMHLGIQNPESQVGWMSTFLWIFDSSKLKHHYPKTLYRYVNQEICQKSYLMVLNHLILPICQNFCWTCILTYSRLKVVNSVTRLSYFLKAFAKNLAIKVAQISVNFWAIFK